MTGKIGGGVFEIAYYKDDISVSMPCVRLFSRFLKQVLLLKKKSQSTDEVLFLIKKHKKDELYLCVIHSVTVYCLIYNILKNRR